MGNCWTGLSQAKFEEYEKKMLSYSGLRMPEDFDIKNVVIDSSGNYIRTIEVGDPSKQTIVLVHGYGGSSIMFYKILKPLAEHYHLILIDILGMGGSSRPQFSINSPTEADEYMIEWLEAWR